jgi:hypothetical protein
MRSRTGKSVSLASQQSMVISIIYDYHISFIYHYHYTQPICHGTACALFALVPGQELEKRGILEKQPFKRKLDSGPLLVRTGFGRMG